MRASALRAYDAQKRLMAKRYERWWQQTFCGRAFTLYGRYQLARVRLLDGVLLAPRDIKVEIINASVAPHDWPQIRAYLAQRARFVRQELR